MTLSSNSANPRHNIVPGFLLLLPSLPMAPQGKISNQVVGTGAHFHLDSAHLPLPPLHCLVPVILCFKGSSAPSHVPKEERREAVELQPPKLPPKKLYQPGDLDATVKPRKKLLHLTHHRHSPVHQTPTHLQASLPSQAGLLRHQPRGRANR